MQPFGVLDLLVASGSGAFAELTPLGCRSCNPKICERGDWAQSEGLGFFWGGGIAPSSMTQASYMVAVFWLRALPEGSLLTLQGGSICSLLRPQFEKGARFLFLLLLLLAPRFFRGRLLLLQEAGHTQSMCVWGVWRLHLVHPWPSFPIISGYCPPPKFATICQVTAWFPLPLFSRAARRRLPHRLFLLRRPAAKAGISRVS